MRLGMAAVIAVSVLAVSGTANAATIFTGNVGGFVENSATSAYLAAQGTPTEHLDFNTDKFNNPLPSGSINGTTLSNNVNFYSGTDSSGSTTLTYSSPGPNSELGPSPSWSGSLAIDFAATGHDATAVGFGVVDPNVTIQVYDASGNLFGTYNSGPDTFDFWGIVGTGGESFSKVVLTNPYYAIQDIQFVTGNGVAATPEPGTVLPIAFGGIGLLSLAIARKRNASKIA